MISMREFSPKYSYNFLGHMGQVWSTQAVSGLGPAC